MHTYYGVPTNDDFVHSDATALGTKPLRRRGWAITNLTAITMFLTLGLGLVVGIRLGVNVKELHLPGTARQVPIQWTKSMFRFDEEFANVPEPAQPEPRWDSLIPNGLGYVQKPPLAMEPSVVSTFHQLHCLYTIRRAYHSNSSDGFEDFDFGLDRKEHTSHCFEYLRQSIMCLADSTLEPAGERQDGGFLGWGVIRQCRDFKPLQNWAAKARMFDATGFLATEFMKGGKQSKSI